jgi:prevent-host-death family protein
MDKTINAKELRASLPQIVRRVRQGGRFTVLYRSRPAFRLVPITGGEDEGMVPLAEDPLFGADAVGQSSDGLSSRDHDAVLYGNASK